MGRQNNACMIAGQVDSGRLAETERCDIAKKPLGAKPSAHMAHADVAALDQDFFERQDAVWTDVSESTSAAPRLEVPDAWSAVDLFIQTDQLFCQGGRHDKRLKRAARFDGIGQTSVPLEFTGIGLVVIWIERRMTGLPVCSSI